MIPIGAPFAALRGKQVEEETDIINAFGDPLEGVGTLSASVTVDEVNTITVDDYDDQNIGPYYGDTSNYDFYSQPISGDYRIGSEDGSRAYIYSDEGLNYYPQRGDQIVCDFIVKDDSNGWDEHGIFFGIQDSSNHYRVDLNQYLGEFAIYKDTQNPSNSSAEASTSVSVPEGTYRVEIDWGAGAATEEEIVARYYESSSSTPAATISTVDSDYYSGGVGHFIWSNQRSGFDYHRAEQLEDIQEPDDGTDGGDNGGSSDVLIIDNFEDGDLNEYRGDTNDYAIVTSPTYSGSYAVHYTGSGVSRMYSNSGDGLNHYPEWGNNFRIYFYSTIGINHSSEHRARVEFFQDHSDAYVDSYFEGSNLWLIDSGSVLDSDSSPDEWKSDTWYYWDVETTTSGSISITIRRASDDVAVSNTLSGTVSSLYGPGFSIKTQDNTSGAIYYDYLHATDW